MPAITILPPVLGAIFQRKCSSAFDKAMESLIFRDPNQQWWRGEEFLTSLFGPFLPWCIAHLLNFYLPCLILRGCTVGLGREVVMTRVGKQILIQATKDFRVKSQALYKMISVSQWVMWLSCYFRGSPPGPIWFSSSSHMRWSVFSFWLCHHSDLQSLVLRYKAERNTLQYWVSWVWWVGSPSVSIAIVKTWNLSPTNVSLCSLLSWRWRLRRSGRCVLHMTNH